MKFGLIGRADLLRVLDAGDPELIDAFASMIGMERPDSAPERAEEVPTAGGEALPEQAAATIETPLSAPGTGFAPIPFLVCETFHRRMRVRHAEAEDSDRDREGSRPDVGLAPVPFEPLVPHASVQSVLRQQSAFLSPAGDLDLERLVARMSRGEHLERLPRRMGKRWGTSIQLVIDRSRRLTPYWTDQTKVGNFLRRFYPQGRFRSAVLREGAAEPWIELPRGEEGPLRPPHQGSVVLALSDLGCLAGDSGTASRPWVELGARLRDNGNVPLVLFPSHPSRCLPALAEFWTIIPWERPEGPVLSREQQVATVERILSLVSFVIWVEPRILRAARRLLPECRWDPGIESLVWQHEAFINRDYEAARFDPDRVGRYRELWNTLDPDLRRTMIDTVAAMRRGEYEGAWNSELLGLERELATGLVTAADFDRARRWFDAWSADLERRAEGGAWSPEESRWFQAVFPWLSPASQGGTVAPALNRLYELTRPSGSRDDLPPTLDPALMPGAGEGPIRTLALSQVSGGLSVAPFTGEPVNSGSLVCLIRTCNGKVKIEPDAAFWEGGRRPAWAVDWGHDPYGAWSEFEVGGVRQRMRWIPPGKFLMGAPEDEEGVCDDETPQFEVTIDRGFWIFNVPCTQSLWEAVMGTNPSQFRGPELPVECVSWLDVQHFLARIVEQIPGLELSIPGEELWEYSCRAGIDRARYSEPLDDISWNEDNSDDATHPVGQKRPNAWGLYDMLGNVWEWCAYLFLPPDRAARQDYTGPLMRGGSWESFTHDLRAAYRLGVEPSRRENDLGFRCVELVSPGPALGITQLPGDRERNSPVGSPVWIDLSDRAEARVKFPTVVPARVLTDLDQVTLGSTRRPSWARDFGRDQFGLWAEFRIGQKVRQRLRWIPPGRFLMGSPEGEVGRRENEGPQREVAIDRGFWMFATPCTQELWEEVMGHNPSMFRSPTRPVESVGWAESNEFTARLNERIKGLELSLPSEAQWEYACRAGTATATYAGDLTILGQNNVPTLDAIAWYSGNCGVDFDLPVGRNMRSWAGKQYAFELGGTRPVGQKRPNAWGLHDMLGNVWEWCADEYRPYQEGSKGLGDHVLRGGSWGFRARGVRSACRYWISAGSKEEGLIGFRCAEFREGWVERAGSMHGE